MPACSPYAKRGSETEGRLYFQNETGGTGEEFLRLKIGSSSLVTRPDGSPIAEGDSVLITVTVVDPTRILFDFQPAGLRFNPADKPELAIHYAEARGDLNGDGSVNSADSTIEQQIAIWRQESLLDPYFKVGSVTVEDLEEVEGTLDGFTRYAIAY